MCALLSLPNLVMERWGRDQDNSWLRSLGDDSTIGVLGPERYLDTVAASETVSSPIVNHYRLTLGY
jgi:hypothetical protein